MIAVVCVDNAYGMQFGGRRQSRDRILLRDLLDMVGSEGTLWIGPCSAALFPQDTARIRVNAEFLSLAGPGEFCFVEDQNLAPYQVQLEGLVLYRWNRDYPADRYLDLRPDVQHWELCNAAEFSGSSHEKITKEEYRMK